MDLKSILLAATAFVFSTSANAATILAYADNDNRLVNAALSQLGETATITSHASFLADLNSQAWDLVIVNTPGSPISAANTTALDNYINSGGSSIISHWLYNGNLSLASAYDVSVASSISSPLSISVWDSSHEIFSGVTGVVDYDRDANDNGDKFNTINGSTALAGFTPLPSAGEAAIVLGNEGRTIANGWLFYDAMLTTNNINLVANQAEYLLTRSVSAVPVPAAAWLFGTALIGLVGFGKRRKAA